MIALTPLIRSRARRREWGGPLRHAAFGYPAAFTPGALGIGTQSGGWLLWPEFSLSKSWQIRERAQFIIRLDGHNIPVHPWFNGPNSVVNLTSPQSFGRFSTAISGTNTSSLGSLNGNLVFGARIQW